MSESWRARIFTFCPLDWFASAIVKRRNRYCSTPTRGSTSCSLLIEIKFAGTMIVERGNQQAVASSTPRQSILTACPLAFTGGWDYRYVFIQMRGGRYAGLARTGQRSRGSITVASNFLFFFFVLQIGERSWY